MIALILGGAPSVWRELAEAQALLNRRHVVVAANLAGIHHAGPLEGWATLHPDLMPQWVAERAGKPAGRIFSPDATPERWPGSSGLYALQCALFEMGASGAILCGVPMEQTAGHFIAPGAWASTGDYRRAFEVALPEIGARARSMGGWSSQLFGAPTAAWVEAIDTARPLGVTAPPEAREPMHTVKNVSDAHASFWALDPADGLSKLHHLNPGESVSVTIDPEHQVFQNGAFKVSSAAPKPAKAKSTARRAKAKPAAPKTAAPSPE